MKLELLKIVGMLFAGGVATSFAENHFQYNLYQTLSGLVAKIRGKKPAAPAAAAK